MHVRMHVCMYVCMYVCMFNNEVRDTIVNQVIYILARNCSKMVPRGLEPRTLRLLAVRFNQLSYETFAPQAWRWLAIPYALPTKMFEAT
jgi:hypothetical protein